MLWTRRSNVGRISAWIYIDLYIYIFLFFFYNINYKLLSYMLSICASHPRPFARTNIIPIFTTNFFIVCMVSCLCYMLFPLNLSQSRSWCYHRGFVVQWVFVSTYRWCLVFQSLLFDNSLSENEHTVLAFNERWPPCVCFKCVCLGLI